MLYTIIWQSDKGRNWERIPAKEAVELIDNLGAYGVEDLTVFTPDAQTISVDVLEGIAALSEEDSASLQAELNAVLKAAVNMDAEVGNWIRCDMTAGKHALVIRVDNGDNGLIYIIEPNRVTKDGALVPIGDNGDATFGNYSDLMKECRRLIVNIFRFVTLSTFPKDDAFFSTIFTVPMEWFEDALLRLSIEESVEDYLLSYIWDSSNAIYELACAEGAAIHDTQVL